MGRLGDSIKLFTDIKYCRTRDEYSDRSEPTWTFSETDSVASDILLSKKCVGGRGLLDFFGRAFPWSKFSHFTFAPKCRTSTAILCFEMSSMASTQ